MNILVIEDEPGDFGLIEAFLRQVKMGEGVGVGVLCISWAKRLAEGIAKVRNTPPALVLLDLTLPDSQGMQTVQALRAELPDIPVIVLTVRDDDASDIAALEHGVQDYLIKGRFDALVLGRAMRHALVRARLEARMRLFESALDAAANGIEITDAQGRIEWVNRAFVRMTGYSLEDAMARTPGELLKSGAQDQAFYQHMWATILAGKSWQGEIVNRRKDGTLYDEMLSIAPVLGSDGEIRNFVAIKQDISHQKRLDLEGTGLLRKIEELIHKATERADHSQETADNPANAPVKPPKLSARQRQVLTLVASGHTSAQIAEQLQINPTTVVSHRRDLMRKLDLHSVAALTRYAIEHKLISG
jgi:PAS domain S-box-containing protein